MKYIFILVYDKLYMLVWYVILFIYAIIRSESINRPAENSGLGLRPVPIIKYNNRYVYAPIIQ